MLPPAARVGVAVSGGADSVVLLHILHLLAPEQKWSLTILHVNHQLRGAESDADEAFVRDLAHNLNLPILCATLLLSPGNIEQEARRARHQFFQSCRRAEPLEKIALGHTRSDQAETILLRLFRGSGLSGLTGMLPSNKFGLVRPLLFSSREEIRDFAITSRLTWRNDSSNEDLHFRRNQLRLVTFPQLAAEYNPSLEAVLTRTAALAQAEESYWKSKIRKVFKNLVVSTGDGVTIQVEELTRLHAAQQRRLIRLMIASVRKDLRSIEIGHVDAVLKISRSQHGHDRVIIPGVDAIRSFSTLLLTQPSTMKEARGYALPVPLSATIVLPFKTGQLIVQPENEERQNCVNVKSTIEIRCEEAYLDRDIVRMISPGELLLIRNWEPGDKFQRVGSSRPEKIKTLFQESKILLWERRHWPVLIVGGEIAWVRTFGTAVQFCSASSTKDLLRLRYEPAL